MTQYFDEYSANHVHPFPVQALAFKHLFLNQLILSDLLLFHSKHSQLHIPPQNVHVFLFRLNLSPFTYLAERDSLTSIYWKEVLEADANGVNNAIPQ